jgi:hypothetical protein
MKRCYYNVNSNVYVKLTPRGKEIYRKFWGEALKGSPIESSSPVLHTDAEGWTEFQMWDLMCIFGSHLYNGCVVPFETNIRFRRDDLATTKPPQK